jgi:hypothetical protein
MVTKRKWGYTHRKEREVREQERDRRWEYEYKRGDELACVIRLSKYR